MGDPKRHAVPLRLVKLVGLQVLVKLGSQRLVRRLAKLGLVIDLRRAKSVSFPWRGRQESDQTILQRHVAGGH